VIEVIDMKHAPLRIAAVGLILAGTCAPVFAVDPLTQSIANKRQVVGCMLKRMRSNRTLSYLDAKKACLDEVKAQSANLASSSSSARGERPPAAAAEPGS
jgi:hypothetical protein